jgi:hypothetical protein
MKRVEHNIAVDAEGNRNVGRIEYEDGEVHHGVTYTECGWLRASAASRRIG